MKVKLISVNSAEYEIKDGKVTEIPFTSFVNLCGGEPCGMVESLPRVRIYKTLNEFIGMPKSERDSIDESQTVRLLNDGRFMVFLKSEVEKDATTNTEENTGE